MLTIIEDLGCREGVRYISALCDCGNIKEFRWQHVKSGGTKSCGCIIGHNGKGVWAIESIGEVFGRLKVLSIIERKNAKPIAVCLCECGKEKNISLQDLRNGKTRSCGCLLSEASRDRMSTHGLSGHPIYRIWKGIRKRCYNKNDKRYPDYGGRGVVMCEEWFNYPEKFFEWAVANGWKKGLDIDKDIKAKELGVEPLLYSPERCMFVTRRANSRETRANIWIEYNGEKKIATDWANQFGINLSTIINRLRKKLPLSEVFHKGTLKRRKKDRL